MATLFWNTVAKLPESVCDKSPGSQFVPCPKERMQEGVTMLPTLPRQVARRANKPSRSPRLRRARQRPCRRRPLIRQRAGRPLVPRRRIVGPVEEGARLKR